MYQKLIKVVTEDMVINRFPKHRKKYFTEIENFQMPFTISFKAPGEYQVLIDDISVEVTKIDNKKSMEKSKVEEKTVIEKIINENTINDKRKFNIRNITLDELKYLQAMRIEWIPDEYDWNDIIILGDENTYKRALKIMKRI